jgi:hypothetical protein
LTQCDGVARYGWDPHGVIDGIVGESGVAIVVERADLHIEGFAGVAGNLPHLGRWRCRWSWS